MHPPFSNLLDLRSRALQRDSQLKTLSLSSGIL